MPDIVTKVVTLFVAFRDGREIGIALDRDALVRDFKIMEGSTVTQVRVFEEAVGVVEGELCRWWEEPGNPGGTKLHWNCPRCGVKEWGDWRSEMTNPCLWYSNCPCIGKWLIHWRRGGQWLQPGRSSGGHAIVEP